ncbi:MAG: TIGR00725 family protein [Candidatus Dormibacteria bacterium]
MTGGARAPLIAVCGATAADAGDIAVAEEVGRLLAGRGAVVICGGLGGVMDGVCRGAAGAGGLSVGLLPGDDPAEANPHVGLVLATGLGELRNGLIARACRGMIAIGGGYGTLSEVAFMLRLGRPVCALGSWSLVPPRNVPVEPAIHRAIGAEDAVGWVLDRV